MSKREKGGGERVWRGKERKKGVMNERKRGRLTH